MSDIDEIQTRLDRLASNIASSDRRLKQSTLTSNKSPGTLTLTIPWSIVEAMKLGDGINVDLEISNNSLIVTPQTKTEYSLEELLAGVTPENCHEEMDWGVPVGGEEW
jgi:antitoxin MazE